MKEEKNPYSAGHNAHYAGHRLKDNPYKRFTEDWREWKSGWQDEDNDDPYWRRNRNYFTKLKFKQNKP